jgi:hypothetical protein
MDKDKKVKSGIGPFTDNIINEIAKKLSSNEFKTYFNELFLDPMFNNITNKIQPYLYMISLLYGIIVILILIIIYLILKKK